MPYPFERKKVGILIFPDVEVLDFCGPFEVFSVIRLKESKRLQQPSPFEVYLIAESQEVVVTSGGLRVLPDYTIGNCPVPHILVIPGGWGVRKEINNKRLISWIYRCSKEVETLTSVCTGAILLGQAGLLDGRSATTHWRSLDWMRNSFKNVNVV
ncbi:MAG: DJ-1/PfpI family protein, partial [bacterium]